MSLFLVTIGGAIGSLLRYLVGKILPTKIPLLGQFPLSTLSVNLLGSLIIGLIGYFVVQKNISEEFRIFFVVGILGGFTTFSSFGLETFSMLEHREYFKMALYLLTTNILGVACVGLGWWISKTIQNL